MRRPATPGRRRRHDAQNTLVSARPQLHDVFEALAGAHAARSRSRRRRPSSTAISTSLLESSSAKKGMSISSPGRAGGRRGPAAELAHHDTRARRPAGSVVNQQARRPPLEPARDDRVGGQRPLGPDLDPLDEAAVARALELDDVHAAQGIGDLGVVDVVAELPLAVEVDVDVLGRRPEREGACVATGAAAGARSAARRVASPGGRRPGRRGGRRRGVSRFQFSPPPGGGTPVRRRLGAGWRWRDDRRRRRLWRRRRRPRGIRSLDPGGRWRGCLSRAGADRPNQRPATRRRSRRRRPRPGPPCAGAPGPPAGAAPWRPRRCSGSKASTRFQSSSALALACAGRCRGARRGQRGGEPLRAARRRTPPDRRNRRAARRAPRQSRHLQIGCVRSVGQQADVRSSDPPGGARGRG